MKFFLTVKHWQLFILQFALPFLLQTILITAFIVFREPLQVLYFFPFLILLILFNHYGWTYTITVNLYRKLPESVSLRLTHFKFFFFFPAIYLTVLLLSVFLFINSDFSIEESWPFVAILFIIPLHLFAIFCNFYCLYFTAKTLKSVELEREARFSDYASEFILLWFSIVGIWIIQPRINKIFDPTANAKDHAELGQ